MRWPLWQKPTERDHHTLDNKTKYELLREAEEELRQFIRRNPH